MAATSGPAAKNARAASPVDVAAELERLVERHERERAHEEDDRDAPRATVDEREPYEPVESGSAASSSFHFGMSFSE